MQPRETLFSPKGTPFLDVVFFFSILPPLNNLAHLWVLGMLSSQTGVGSLARVLLGLG